MYTIHTRMCTRACVKYIDIFYWYPLMCIDTYNFSPMLGKRTNLFCRYSFIYSVYPCFFQFTRLIACETHIWRRQFYEYTSNVLFTDASSFDISRGQFIPDSSRIFHPKGKQIFIRYQSSVSLSHPLRFVHSRRCEGNEKETERETERRSYSINPLQ